MSATMNDALTEALLWLSNEGDDNRLADVMFGRYADQSGFWWTMRFTRKIRNSEVEDSWQDQEQRISMVVSAWSEAMDGLRASAPDPRIVVPS